MRGHSPKSATRCGRGVNTALILIGAEHVQALLRPIKDGGLLVIYMNDMHYESGWFAERFQRLEREGVWRIERREQSNYMSELERPGWLLVTYKLPD